MLLGLRSPTKVLERQQGGVGHSTALHHLQQQRTDDILSVGPLDSVDEVCVTDWGTGEQKCSFTAAEACVVDAETDPVDALEHLRSRLAEARKCKLVLRDTSPGLLLDVVSMLHLLNQDLRLEHDHETVVAFKPSLSSKVRPLASSVLRSLPSSSP